MRNRPNSRTIGLAFAATSLIITWVGFASYWSTHRLVRSFGSVSETHQALEKLQAIRALMEAGASDTYNYVITGRTDRLGIYLNAKTVIPRKLREVEALLKGHPGQKKNLRKFRQLFQLHADYLQKIVVARQDEGFEAASQWIVSEDDRAVRQGLDSLLADVQFEANRTLKKRSASTSEHSQETQTALIGAAGVSLFLIACVFWMLRRENRERRSAEHTNVRLESFLRSIVERIPYMILVKEATHLRLTLVNKAAMEWLGRTEAELLGSNEYDLRPDAAARVLMQQEREILQKGGVVDIPEEVLVREGQEERILHTQKVAIPDENGNPAFLLIISEDITRRKHAERMLELSRDAAVKSERLKSEFIRNVSHEFRTPLSIIIGMITILLDSELSPEQRAFAGKVDKAAAGLSKLAKGILDFSRIESGIFTLEPEELNLNQTLESILTMLNPQAKAKGVGLLALIPPTIPPVVVGDPVRLRQVLTELVSNAVKFTPRGEVVVHVNEVEQTDHQIWLTFKVTDTGPGISAEVQEHLFEPFRQGDGSPTRRFGGTGLGLAICKRIVELMGGKIGCDSAANQGSTFWCTIPFQKRGVQGPIPVAPAVPWTRARVLVIEENEIFRKQLRDQLSSWALANEGVASGESALQLLRREQKAGRPFRLVVLDIHLADMEAVSFLKAVKEDPALAGLQSLLLAESALDQATANAMGFTACVPKPMDPETLYARLAGLIESSSSAAESAA